MVNSESDFNENLVKIFKLERNTIRKKNYNNYLNFMIFSLIYP